MHLSWSPTLLNIVSSAWYDRYSYVGCQLLATQLLHFLPHHRLTKNNLPQLCFSGPIAWAESGTSRNQNAKVD